VVTGMQHKHVLNAICKLLAIDLGTGWMMQVDMVTRQLEMSPRTLILDEAQRLSYESFDLLKYLADNSGSTFVLIGSASLITRIERWPDIDSRCPVKVKVETMGLAEFVNLYKTDGYTTATLEEMHAQTKGVMRNVMYLLMHIEEELTKSKITKNQIAPGHIRKLAEAIF
jgi:DNA transposition AAA+ family ATPase